MEGRGRGIDCSIDGCLFVQLIACVINLKTDYPAN